MGSPLETKWYRGEAVNVEQAKPYAVKNDIGDGMYFSDREDVAAFYASRRALKPEDERVYHVSLANIKSGTGQGSVRVLDLTTHPGWKKHIEFKVPPQGANDPWTTVEDKIRRLPEQYSKSFKEFVENPKNGVNLKDYDAVVGHEYINGGKQMCILYKKGSNGVLGPSKVQVEVRKPGNYIPIRTGPANPIPGSPPGSLRFGGKIGPGLKVVGGTLLVIVANVLLHLLIGKAISDLNQKSIEKQLQGRQPEIEKAIHKRKREALKLLADGQKAWATIRVTVRVELSMNLDEIGGGWDESTPMLDYDGNLAITAQDESKEDGDEILRPAPFSRTRLTHFKLSFPITFSEEEVGLFRNHMKQIDALTAAAKATTNPAFRDYLNDQAQKLTAQLNAALDN